MAQQITPRSAPSRQGTNTRRRTLLLTVLLLVAVAGLVFVWRGSNQKSGSGTSDANHRVVAIQGSKTKKTTTQHHTKSHTSAKHKSVTHRATKKSGTSTLARYAQQLLPVLDRSRAVFDNSAAGAARASSNFGVLGTSCGQIQNQLSILSTRADDVPHPQAWWTRVGRLHHQMMGIYNNMLGATSNCIIASQSGESDTAASSISDMSSSDHRMRHFDDYTHWLAKHG